MNKTNIFDFEHYRDFLQKALRRGMQASLAENLNCQAGFISQVLKGTRELSLEHAFKTAAFLGLNKQETQFFMLLVNRDRAATQELKDHFSEQLAECCDKKDQVHSRIQANAMVSDENLARYLSHWYIAAIHIMITISQFQTVDAIAAKLGLARKVVAETLEFLMEQGLIVRNDEGYSMGQTRIHLPNSSSMITAHHTNWRLEAMKALDRSQDNNDALHYSSVMTMSLDDQKLLRRKILQLIDEFEPILAASPSDELVCFTIDLFGY